MTALLADLQGQSRGAERLAVKSSGRVILLKTKEIDWIEAADYYVKLHVEDQELLIMSEDDILAVLD